MAGKGNPKGVGKPKGALNRDNKAVKDMLREALARRGNSDYFYEQMELNPVAFMSLVGKLIPNEVNIDAVMKHKFEPLIIKGIE